MYGKTKALVRVNDVCSNKFRCNVGVRQGCPLIPILFCLYISDVLPQAKFLQIALSIGCIDIGILVSAIGINFSLILLSNFRTGVGD